MPSHSGSDEGGLNRRQLLAATGGTAVAVAAAGCSQILGGGGNGNGDVEQVEGDVPDEPIQAGLQAATEGAGSVIGNQNAVGAQIAVDRINEAGGIAGREMELEVVFEGGEFIENYEQFVSDGAEVTFGPTSSGGHEALAPVVEDEGVINVGHDGTVTTLYEETVPDPTYSFRFQNYDVMECVAAALDTVERYGVPDTVAGVNPNYAFGRDEFSHYVHALEQINPDLEVVYEGYPELGASDMSSHMSSINSAEPDVVFTSNWGADAITFLSQADANDVFDNVELVEGTVLYGTAAEIDPGIIEGTDTPIAGGIRNHYWDHPPHERWSPGEELITTAQEEYDVASPGGSFMSGYGAVMSWATAAEKAVDLLGYWPSQEELARMLEGHGFFSPAGYHNMAEDHQGRSNAHYGEIVPAEGSDPHLPVELDDIQVYSATEVAPPPGQAASDWIDSWEPTN
jgi:branched-chain amino acid transport system substrate-binding protein